MCRWLSSEAEQEEELELYRQDGVEQQYCDEYEAGRYSPVLFRQESIELGTVITDPLVDLERLQFKRREVLEKGLVMVSTNKKRKIL